MLHSASRKAKIKTIWLTGLLMVMQVPLPALGGELKPETKAAWDEYMKQATAAMQARLQPSAKFLWVDEDPERLQEVHEHGPDIAPMEKHIPKKVSSGLIHHWIGAGFLPGAKIDEIVLVLRDYDHYKDVYRPGVLDSHVRSTDGNTDSFFLRFANRSVVSKTALDTEGQATYIRLDEHRLYAYSNTTKIQEVDKVGTPEERLLPPDVGTGLIWRLSSFTRLEERDGGVYGELEAIALSRDIPGALRPFVMPIVRRVSRDSLATSLRQTRVAIEGKMPHAAPNQALAVRR